MPEEDFAGGLGRLERAGGRRGQVGCGTAGREPTGPHCCGPFACLSWPALQTTRRRRRPHRPPTTKQVCGTRGLPAAEWNRPAGWVPPGEAGPSTGLSTCRCPEPVPDCHPAAALQTPSRQARCPRTRGGWRRTLRTAASGASEAAGVAGPASHGRPRWRGGQTTGSSSGPQLKRCSLFRLSLLLQWQ